MVASSFQNYKLPPTLEKFCCGFSLKFGVWIVAIYQMVVHVVHLVKMYVSFKSATHLHGTLKHLALFETSCTTILYSFELILGCGLTFALASNRIILLKTWMWVSCGIQVFHAIVVVSYFVALVFEIKVSCLTEELLDSILNVFCILVVYSYWSELTGPKDDNAQQISTKL